MTLHDEDKLPFTWGWWGVDLGQARPVEHTYKRFPYDSLPPLPALDGTFAWLGPMYAEGNEEAYRKRDMKDQIRLAHLQNEATPLGLTLPPSYLRLMGSSELQDRIPEYAGSWFPPTEHIVSCIGEIPGFLIRFFADQQDVVVWFLYLTPQGDELVIGSHDGDIDGAQWEDLHDGSDPTAEEMAQIIAHTMICAPSFEAFCYRFWLEVTLSSKLHGYNDTPFTAAEQRYLAHYGMVM